MNTARYKNSIRAGLLPYTACAVVVLANVLPAASAFAHHSVPVNFDTAREISVTGILTEIKWLNPHSHFWLDVTDEDGSTVEWLVEMGAFNTMRRAGFETDRFSLGQLVTITGWPGRRDRVVYLNRALMSDGTELLCIGARCNLTEED